MTKYLMIVVFTLFSLSSLADSLPRQLAVPGGVVLVELSDVERVKPTAHFGKKRVAVVEANQKWVAVVGVPLAAKPGSHRISVTQEGKKRTVLFDIEDKAYPTQYITLKDKRKVNPNKLDMERINGERGEIRAALRYWTDKPALPAQFEWPIEGIVTGVFGNRRVFNGQPRRPHSGIDIAAPLGTPIKAPAAGIVRETGDYFFNGKTVFLDHGQNLITMYCHMDQINVTPGQEIKAGEIIGTVGSTGRSTGPHLHLGVSLNDVRVEPELFFPAREQ